MMKPLHLAVWLLTTALIQPNSGIGQSVSAHSKEHQQVLVLVSDNTPHYQQVSKQIWDYAELGYHEQKSSALLQQELKAAGFAIETPMPDIATAFVASYGSGKPVIGILG